jgi:hypothetical protein
MAAVFGSRQDAESENAGQLSVRRFASSGKALFFGSFLLGQQKK